MIPFDCPPAAGAQDRLRQNQDRLRFEGHAAVWDRVDRAGDVMRRGAFGGPAPVPLLRHHRGGPVGTILEIEEDAHGLRVAGEVADAEVSRLVRCGALAGLSVGYRPLVVRQGARRELVRVALAEVSLVAVPMQAAARVHQVF